MVSFSKFVLILFLSGQVFAANSTSSGSSASQGLFQDPNRVEPSSKPVIIDPPKPVVITVERPRTPTAWNVFLGMQSGAGQFGADYETMKSDSTGLAPYFFYSGKESTTKIYQQSSVGLSFKAHLYPGFWDFYFAPGINLTQAEIPPSGTSTSTSNKSVLGPSIRIGGLYRVSSKTAFGLETMNTYNWFDKELTGNYSYASLVLRFEM